MLINLFVNCIAVADGLKPSHVGLEHEAQLARSWKRSMNGGNGRNGTPEGPPIKYIHLHECDKFSVSILIVFVLAACHCLIADTLFEFGWRLVWTLIFGSTTAKADFLFIYLFTICRLEYSVCLLVL